MCKRIGTYTLGLSLIAFGLFGILNVIMPEKIDIVYILKFWPGTLILLGIEVLIYSFVGKESCKYDAATFFIIALMGGCSAVAILLTEYYPNMGI